MSFVFGRHFRLRVFGKSHAGKIGVTVSGVPKGFPVGVEDIQRDLDRRKPGQSLYTTQRKEEDKVVIESGVVQGRATGKPIRMVIYNKDAKAAPYTELRGIPRPGHADFTARAKYGEKIDLRGGGFFSGRMTACFVMAGAIAKAILRGNGIKSIAFLQEAGGIGARDVSDEQIESSTYESPVRCPDPAAEKKIMGAIEAARMDGDSVGGIIECRVLGLPAGLGEPMFGSLESTISQFAFAIPAVKGIEFGSGFKASRLKGSENNDAFALRNGKVVTLTNNSGGILGGLSTGMPLVFRVAFKPTSSISKQQQTLNPSTGKMETLRVTGRHDPCIAIRAVPVVEAAAAICIADYLLSEDKKKIG